MTAPAAHPPHACALLCLLLLSPSVTVGESNRLSEEKNPWRLAPEYQLYDSYNVKVRGERCAGSLYGLVAAPTGLARKPGEWDGTWSWRHVLDKKLVGRSAASEPRP